MRSHRWTRALDGLLRGLAIGFVLVVLATALTVFATVHAGQSPTLLHIAEAQYAAGPGVGFQLSVSPGVGLPVVLLAAAALGSVVSPVVRGRRLRSHIS